MLKPFLLFLSLVLISCSQISYNTYYQGVDDPTFEFRSVKTIGFTPFYWTTSGKNAGVDELTEKQIYAHCKRELETRGYTVTYIPPDKLEEVITANGSEVYCRNLDQYPDLTFTVAYGYRDEIVTIEGRRGGYVKWGKNETYVPPERDRNVKIFNLFIGCVLWTGKPKYMQQVWRGEIYQGSPTPNLIEQSKTMVQGLFREKFPK